MRFLDALFKKILYPLRVAIRFEIRRELERERQFHQERSNKLLCDITNPERLKDLRLAAQREATQTTTDYLIARMPKVPAFDSQKEVLDFAIQAASLSETHIICEFGVWKGNTINYIASKVRNRVVGFDSFSGLPEDWRTGFLKGHFALDYAPEVVGNVELVNGSFEDTLPPFVRTLSDEIRLIHIDCDLYSSTAVVLEHLQRQLRPGCVIVFDEYFNYPGWQNGEHKAFVEFVEHTGHSFKYIAYNQCGEQVAVVLTSSGSAAASS